MQYSVNTTNGFQGIINYLLKSKHATNKWLDVEFNLCI
jgi:hypothetical protein